MCAPCCFQWWRALGRAASRRDFVKGALMLPLVAAGCATTSTASQASGRALLDDVVSIDVHTHPALFQTYSRTTIDEHARAIESGKLGGTFLAAVGDGAALSTRNGTPYAARQPAPGVLFASAWRQLDVLDGHAGTLGMRRVLRGSDLEAAAAGHARVAIMSVEGADFLEGRLEHVQRAYDRGVRSIQLVHYRVNELGDIQTVHTLRPRRGPRDESARHAHRPRPCAVSGRQGRGRGFRAADAGLSHEHRGPHRLRALCLA